jgi:hypothetical protein
MAVLDDSLACAIWSKRIGSQHGLHFWVEKKFEDSGVIGAILPL